MTHVSVTRLRIRSVWFMPGFAVYAASSERQCRRAAGFLGGSLLPDRRLTFWTMTLWRDQAAVRAYMTSGAHLRAMPRLMAWCDEASVVHWTQDDAVLPSWEDADRAMRTLGRPSKLRHPSACHVGLSFAAPRASWGTSRATPVRPAAAR